MSSSIGSSTRVGQLGTPQELQAQKGVQQAEKPGTNVAKLANQTANPVMNDRTSCSTRTVRVRYVPPAGSPEAKASLYRSASARMASGASECFRTCGLDDCSPSARAVYGTLDKILGKVDSKLRGDFTSGNIGRALRDVVEKDGVELGGTGTVGVFDKEQDDGIEGKGSKNGKPSTWEKPMESAKVCASLNISGGIGMEDSKDPYPANKFLKKAISGAKIEKNPQGGCTVTLEGANFKIHCDEGIDPGTALGQFDANADTFSGDIHVHKLEPGTVLVRVFGQGQSPLRPCWCRLDDSSSSVTCAKDLLEKLAVRPDWNGDGNMAVMIVPEDIDVVVAEGTIATQRKDYSEKGKDPCPFLFSGGGTQLNILTKDKKEGEVGYPPFANDATGNLTGCMFCFRNTDMACVLNHLPQEQNQ